MMFQSPAIDPTSLLSGDEGSEAEEQPAEGEDTVSALNLDVDVGQYIPEQVRPVWEFVSDYPLVLVLLLGAAGWGIGKVIQMAVRKVLEQGAKRTKTDLDDRLISLLSAPIIQTTVTLSLIVAILAFHERTNLDQVIIRSLVTLLLFFWARAWLKATHLALEAMSKNVRRFELFQPRTVPLFEMGIKILLVLVFAYFFMSVWGINATAWLASAGIIGIAVGFAARDTLANLISGVSIVADAPYKIGDYIVLDTGERGVVTSLGIRSTRLLTRDDVEVSIPNAVIGNAKITNESGGPWVKQRIRIAVGVAYGSDTEEVVKVLEEIALDNPDVVERPEPRVRMRAFGDSSLDFELLCWINHPEDRGKVSHELFMEVDKRFREREIVIPFPQRDVHIHDLGEETASKPNLDTPEDPKSNPESKPEN
ncbi:MAG TPA: mechanosensitive ion channel domain-containing protein [Xanthomonadales bacterium]|nr:mechanosensitive ion channel domain-containing protein [Xanthomonadales bacterium]